MPVATALPEHPLAVDTNILTAWRHKENKLQQSIKDYIIRFKTPPALPSFVAFEALDGLESGISKAGETTELMQRDLIAVASGLGP